MFQDGALNNYFVDLYGATAYLTKASPAGLENARTIEFMVDFMPLRFLTTAAPAPNMTVFGEASNLGWFEYDAAITDTVTTAPIRFGAIRNSVGKYSGDGSIELGRRTCIYGLDNGSNVYAWQDGTALGSATAQADWTTAQAAYPLDRPTALNFGVELVGGTLCTPLRLYEVWIKVNSTKILHYRPKPYMADLATPIIKDLSEYGNDGTPNPGLESPWRIRDAWGKSPAQLSVGIVT